MARRKLDSAAISTFCESVAVMYSAGIQTEEAAFMLSEGMGTSSFRRCCNEVYENLIQGKTLTESMLATGAFPGYVLSMVGAGEHSGRLEDVLWSLAKYYDEEARLFTKIRNAIAYPAALLCIMSVILLFVVCVILPVFSDVYSNFAGELSNSSFSYVGVSITIGTIALVIILLSTFLVLISLLMARTSGGQRVLIKFLEHMPITRKPLLQLSIARFTTALSTCMAAGINPEMSMERAMGMVDNAKLRKRLNIVVREMTDPSINKPMAQAISDNGIFNPMYSRMLLVGSRAGSIETVLASLSGRFFDDAIAGLDRLIDGIEPALAAFLTISVGCTLVAVMLPLIGIMGAIG